MSKKMTKKEFQNYIISEAKKLYKVEVLKEEKEKIIGQLKMLNENYDDEYQMTAEEKAEEEKLTQKYKKRILNYIPKFNELVTKAVDGLGYPMEFKVYPTDPDKSEIYPIEINGDEITISCGEFSDTYNLNNFNDYGDSNYEAKLNYWFFRFYKLLEKGVKELEGGQNYYNYYIIDIEDNNRILDTASTREWGEIEKKSSYYDYPGARVVSKNQLIKIGGKPIVIGG